MPASKIVNEQEVIRWFEEGRTYQWMIEEYRRKYNIETVPSMWGNFRRRRGLQRRIVRDDELIPWEIKRDHRWNYDLQMLRVEGRRRAGAELRESDVQRVNSWLAKLEEAQAVIHYEPETEEGFFWVPREPGDDDLIRRPKSGLTQRKAAD